MYPFNAKYKTQGNKQSHWTSCALLRSASQPYLPLFQHTWLTYLYPPKLQSITHNYYLPAYLKEIIDLKFINQNCQIVPLCSAYLCSWVVLGTAGFLKCIAGFFPRTFEDWRGRYPQHWVCCPLLLRLLLVVASLHGEHPLSETGSSLQDQAWWRRGRARISKVQVFLQHTAEKEQGLKLN